MKRKINIEVLFQLIILFGYALFLAAALISNNIKNYIHPRFIVYLWVSVIALFVIGIFLLPNLFKPKHSVHLMPYVILMIPMLTAFSLPANSDNNQTVSFGYNSNQKTAASVTTAETSQLQNTQTTISQPTTESTKETSVNSDSFTNGQLISDDNYAAWYMDCYDHPDKYNGKSVQFKAKIYNFDEAAENEFMPARPCMVCCAADTEPWGFLSRYDQIKNFKDGDWVIVTAAVKVEDYNGQTMPILYVSNLTSAATPKDEYIYFAY